MRHRHSRFALHLLTKKCERSGGGIVQLTEEQLVVPPAREMVRRGLTT
jgi:hypothetical protein